MHGSRHAEEVFHVQEYDPHATLRIGDVTVSFCQVEHYIPSFAMRVEADGKSIAYSGDSAPCESLVALAHNADLLLCEATDPVGGTHHGQRGHMSAEEAGQVAARAEAKQLLLTHYWHQYDREAMLKAARSVYPGVCGLAEEGKSYEV
jgi:ribonuclease BN (tRNA processing enzyme)